MASLFTPFTLKTITLKNRIAVSPMCQYSADEGLINDWHQVHLATLAHGGASLVIAEATAVSPEGRITPGCAGIWTDDQGQAWARAAAAIKAAGAVPGIRPRSRRSRGPAPIAHGKAMITSPRTILAAGGDDRPLGGGVRREPAEGPPAP